MTEIAPQPARSRTSAELSRRPWRWTCSCSHSPSGAKSPAPIRSSRSPRSRVGGLPELAGDHVAEAVGGEVAEGAARPVHVLEHAVGVVGDLEPEVLACSARSRPGEVSKLERAVEELELQLEADQDVEVVGELVGLDPDQGALDPVRRPVELAASRPGERLAEPRASCGGRSIRGTAGCARPSSPRGGSGTRAGRASAAWRAASAPAPGPRPSS